LGSDSIGKFGFKRDEGIINTLNEKESGLLIYLSFGTEDHSQKKHNLVDHDHSTKAAK
jgi:hypothetical protein